MAGEVAIPITVEGEVSLIDALQRELQNEDLQLVVVHEPGACGPCRGNDDPLQVPYPGCIGNVAGHHPESAHAQAIGNLCKCTTRVVRRSDRDVEPSF